MDEGRRSLQEEYATEEGILAQYMDYIYCYEEHRKSTAYNYYATLRIMAKFLIRLRDSLPCEIVEVELPKFVPDTLFMSITADEFYSYLDYYRFEAKERSTSYATRISVVRGFYQWLFNDLHGKEVPYFILDTARPAYNPSTGVSLIYPGMEKKLYQYFLESQPEALAARNICILHLMLNYGLTLNDIINLELSDINVNSISVRTGAKPREIRLQDDAVACINEYLSIRPQPKTAENPFFVADRKGGRLRPCSMQKMLRTSSARVFGGKTLTFRDVRATALRRMATRYSPESMFELSNIGTEFYFSRLLASATK